MWRIVGPKEAIHHPFLMHEILAYSALHMAWSQPDQRKSYHSLGIHHQDLAIRALRKILPSMTAENAGVLFATSALVTLSVFGSKALDAQMPESNPRPSTIDDLLDIFALIQGVDCILSWAYPIVGHGPFGPALRTSLTGNPEQPVLKDIYDYIPSFTAILATKSMDEAARTEMDAAIEAVKTALEFSMAPYRDNRELRFMFLWPIKLSSNFLSMLRQRHPAALVCMGIYALLMRVAEPIYWFMEGWSERVVAAILEAIEPSWVDAMQWSLQAIKAQSEIEEQNRRAQELEVQIR